MKLLRSLHEQPRPVGWHVEVRVVNNDANSDQDRFRAQVQSCLPGARVAREPRRNIAHARNAAVRLGFADAFLFIDDDEVPSHGWLRGLLRRIEDADAVFGPVAGRVPSGTSPWLVRSGAFDKPGPDHDGSIGWKGTRTSSAAVRGSWFQSGRKPFDPAYGLSGGSDTEFFRRIELEGARFVHERSALVYEDIDPDRCRWPAVLKRRYRAGAVYGRMERCGTEKERSARLVARCTAGVVHLLAGVPFAIAGRPERAFNAVCQIAIALGAWRGHDPDFRVTRYPERPRLTRIEPPRATGAA